MLKKCKSKGYPIERVKAYIIGFKGPTNTKGSRIYIKEVLDGKKHYYSYDYEIGDILIQGKNIIGKEVVGYDYSYNTSEYIVFTK